MVQSYAREKKVYYVYVYVLSPANNGPIPHRNKDPRTKTRSVFERYNIVDEKDLKLASKRMQVYHLERSKIESGHSLGTVEAQEAQIQLEHKPAIH